MMRRPIESQVQDLVYTLEVGAGFRWLQAILTLLVVLSSVFVFTSIQFKGLKDREAMEFAELGRNLLFTGKMNTQQIRPLDVWYWKGRETQKVDVRAAMLPDVRHPPLYPMLLAGGFTVVRNSFSQPPAAASHPPERHIMVPMNHLFALMTGVLVFLIGRRLFNPRIATFATLVFCLSRLVWEDSISARGFPVAWFWMLGAVYLTLITGARITAAAPLRKWLPLFVGAALCCALAFLTRYAAIVIVPPVLLYLGFCLQRRSFVWLPVFLALVMAFLMPWFVRNYSLTGNPMGMAFHEALANSPVVDEGTLESHLDPVLGIQRVSRALQHKWFSQVTAYYRDGLWHLGEGLFFPLFLCTFFLAFTRPEVRRLRWCVLLGMLGLVVLGGFYGETSFRLMTAFWPFAILYGMAFLYVLIERLSIRFVEVVNIMVGFVIVLSALPFASVVLPPRPGLPYPPYFPPFIGQVCDIMQPQDTLCTDMPWATAWYGNRTSFLLPRNTEEFYEINDKVRPLHGLYFTTLTRDVPYARGLRAGPQMSWYPIFEGRIPADFPLRVGFHLNNFDQLFLTDEDRMAAANLAK